MTNMKKLSIPFAVFLGFAAFVVPGCEKEKNVPLRGDLIGYVKLIDEKGNPQRDNSSTNVTLGETIAASTTDASGKFEMSDIPVGTYPMKFEREGYGVYKLFNESLTGGNEPGVVTDITLVGFPTMTVSNIKATISDNSSYTRSINISGDLKSVADFYLIRLYVNDSSDVSNQHYDFQGGMQYCCGGATTIGGWASTSATTYPPNTKLYVAVYAIPQANAGGAYSYYDLDTRLWVDPTAKKLGDPVTVIW